MKPKSWLSRMIIVLTTWKPHWVGWVVAFSGQFCLWDWWAYEDGCVYIGPWTFKNPREWK